MITIDGSMGEGGGQILRTTLALAMVTGESVRVTDIRAGRRKPGLLRQHLTCVRAASRVCGGRVEGDRIGSSTITFRPGALRAGDYTFSIGTAGSTSLVLQTILPALMTASEPSTIAIEGGTHNVGAPTTDFLRGAFAPVLERIGARLVIDLERHGFVPAGGGRIRARVQPGPLRPIVLLTRGGVQVGRAVALIASLPRDVAEREISVVKEILGWSDEDLEVEVVDALCPGNVVTITVRSEHVTEVFTGFGERGAPAERVAGRIAKDVRDHLRRDVPVWKHLADQIMLPLALAGGGTYRTTTPTGHARTNAAVIERFLDLRIRFEEDADRSCVVSVG